MLFRSVKGTALEGLAENFKGDTAVAFAHEDDPMAAARILCKYQDGDKSKKFVVKAGFMEGKAMTVSYTHLDVYKRQLHFLSVHKGFKYHLAVVFQCKGDGGLQLLLIGHLGDCLLYTSRCV